MVGKLGGGGIEQKGNKTDKDNNVGIDGVRGRKGTKW